MFTFVEDIALMLITRYIRSFGFPTTNNNKEHNDWIKKEQNINKFKQIAINILHHNPHTIHTDHPTQQQRNNLKRNNQIYGHETTQKIDMDNKH